MSPSPPAVDHQVLATQRYLSQEEAAAYLRFPSRGAFWAWAKRQGLKACKAGRLNLYRRVDLEQHVERSLGRQEQARPRLVRRKGGATRATAQGRPA